MMSQARKKLQLSPSQQKIAQLETLTHRLAWNHDFGCYTRNGFEHLIWPEIASRARYLVYFDIDQMKILNDTIGKPEVNARIRQALGILRSTDHVAAGQFFSGDEFVIVICEAEDGTVGDPKGLIERLANEFKAVQMKATYGFDAVKGTDLVENVQPVADLVHEYKTKRGASR
jgi:GGDEF domain-containing protein